MHTHPDYVVYFLRGGTLRITYPDGHSSETPVTEGEVVYRESVSHAIENIGDTEARAILIELKRADR